MNMRILPHAQRAKAAALWRYCFGDSEEFTSWYFERRAGDIYALGEDRLIAQTVTVPVSIDLRGKACEGRMVSGVATNPEFRKQGHMTKLFVKMYEALRREGVAVLALYPFDYAFYRRYGWAQCGEVLKVRTPIGRLPTARPAGEFCMAETATEALGALADVYNSFFDRYSGHVARDEAAFASRLEELKLDDGYAALYRLDGRWKGYILYHMAARELIVDEMAGISPRARMDILSFLGNHASTADTVAWVGPADDSFLRMLEDARGIATLEPYDMLRILDLPGALGGVPAAVGEIALRVEDEHAPWNAGCWALRAQSGALRVEKIPDQELPILSIHELAQWASGYISAGTLVARGAAIGPALAAAMDRLLPKKPFFLYEMY